MKVLFVASEGVPFVKTGGLADVIGSLPRELRKQGLDVRVVLPKYGDIPDHFKQAMVTVKELTVPLGWRKQYCGVQELIFEGVPFYFIDNEYYFNRPGLYDHGDEAERFAFFCRAVLEALPHLDFVPDILHCHDWHTGMVSVFLKAHYGTDPFYQRLRTVFTIHNLNYQGVFPGEILGDLLGLGQEYFTPEGIEFYDQVNFMKGGIHYSDLITTVSETYAREIQMPYYGEKLDGSLKQRSERLQGIVNGIDYERYDPWTDPFISKNYHGKAPAKKRENKKALQSCFQLPQRADVPVLALVSRLVGHKGLDLLAHILEELLALDVQMVILGTGEQKYEAFFRSVAGNYPDKLAAWITFSEDLSHVIYAGADIFVMPSLTEPCGLGQIIALRYGCIPVVRETGGLMDTVEPYNEMTGEGNGFRFANYNAHDLLFTLKEAIDLYQQKKIWNKIVRNAMKSDFSWYKSALKYQNLYKMLINP
ncbi:glycogen synthase GlgA [Desulforamulus ruminis]|uniref:Glycogen synthase n=1 Tax=Desulforamulus ruminis (strain ATCC 23193 / DSM 2154 / NCIMB 8452 / DL) TaxID=696281 RepID=F6DPX3_DESRL|nr:glycogen synthase GlgA [Desulforamulus ruminis]AEG60812.1 glycogen/starch synthase, ADP-glucose type [Desulforamulus ruminis DSM 2154]